MASCPPNRPASAVSRERLECAGMRDRGAGGGAGQSALRQRRRAALKQLGELRVIAAARTKRQWAGLQLWVPSLCVSTPPEPRPRPARAH